MLALLPVLLTAPAPERIVVDLTRKHQTIAGFGGSLIVFSGEDRRDQTDPKFIERAVHDLGVSLVRVPMPQEWEWRNDNADPTTINWDGFRMTAFANETGADWRLKLLQKFKAAGVHQFLASTWSPPPFTKTNRSVTNAGYLRMDRTEEYAEYMAAWVELAQRYDIDFRAVTLQNELLFNHSFRSTVYDGAQLREAVRAVQGKFDHRGLQTEIFLPEDMMEFGRMENYIRPTMADPVARKFRGGFATHRLGGFDEVRRWREHTKKWGKPNWMTETSGHPQTWDGALKMASDIHDYLVGGDYAAWIYWQLTDRKSSGEYALMVDGQPTPKYYAAKHFYRYVRPGAVRVASTHEKGDVVASAFRDEWDQKLTVVLINRSDKPASATVAVPKAPKPIRFERLESTRQAGGDGAGCVRKAPVPSGGAIVLPPRSITTLVGNLPSGGSRFTPHPDYPSLMKPVGDFRPVDLGPGWGIGEAARNDSLRTLEREIAAGKVNARRYDGQNAAHIALQAGSGDSLKRLLEAGVDVKQPDASGWTPLHMAAATWGPGGDRPNHGKDYRIIDLFRMVMAKSPDVNVRDADGWTPLHAAAANCKTRDGSSVLRIRDLLAAGARVNARDAMDRTPLHLAAWQGYMDWILTSRHEHVQALLDGKAAVDARDKLGRTPLHYAALMGYDRIVAALLRAGANPVAQDRTGQTPADLATSRGMPEIVRLLKTPRDKVVVPDDRNPDRPNRGRLGPELVAAARRGDLAEVQRLLKEGADALYTDGDGFRASQRARDAGHTEIARLLEERERTVE
ncbi:MAG: ankyrin repeat domain-containing protein [Fimbriimonas sp.]